MNPITVRSGEGNYAVTGQAILCGRDITAAFTGGTLAHVGAVSLAVYEPERDSATVSTVTVYSHRDDRLSARGAKKIAAKMKCTAAVSVGIHLDDAAKSDVDLLCRNFEACLDRLLTELRGCRHGLPGKGAESCESESISGSLEEYRE